MRNAWQDLSSLLNGINAALENDLDWITPWVGFVVKLSDSIR